MSNRIVGLVVFGLVVFACSTDPLSEVENCSDLLRVTSEQVAILGDEPDARNALNDDVAELGREMAADAVARGAELEAFICLEAMSEAFYVEEVFEACPDGSTAVIGECDP